MITSYGYGLGKDETKKPVKKLVAKKTKKTKKGDKK